LESDDVLVDSLKVCEMIGGKSLMTLHRWRARPELKVPEPIKINGRNYWSLNDQILPWLTWLQSREVG